MLEKTPQMQNRVQYNSVPSKTGVLQPQTGKSSQKTKETMHLGVLGEPQNKHRKRVSFLDLFSLNNHVSLAHQPRSLEA